MSSPDLSAPEDDNTPSTANTPFIADNGAVVGEAGDEVYALGMIDRETGRAIVGVRLGVSHVGAHTFVTPHFQETAGNLAGFEALHMALHPPVAPRFHPDRRSSRRIGTHGRRKGRGNA